MHNESYARLQVQSSEKLPKLGVRLPKMTQARLNIQSSQCCAAQVCAKLEQLQATAGWIMYRDQTLLSAKVPERHDFIEGEWCNQQTSVKVKHLFGDTYLYVTMTINSGKNESQQQDPEHEQQYKEQLILLHNMLQTKQHNAVKYRQWYTQGTSSDLKGRHLPLMQQFVGFIHTASIQELS
jgi:hypothetical protein